MEGNDAAIFVAVADQLKAMGHEVETIHEDKMRSHDYTPYDRVFSMARNTKAIMDVYSRLDEENRLKFVNNLNGAAICAAKGYIAMRMQLMHMPQPRFITEINGNPLCGDVENARELSLPLWLKNCDNTTTRANDTIYCPTRKDFSKALAKMRRSGIKMWLTQEHVAGDLIKFYGVEGTDFFHWEYASITHSKFGLEEINGVPHGYEIDLDIIKDWCDRLARAIGVPVYGCDVVITPQTRLFFIDYNDFPSFSSCRDEAAAAIARRILQTPVPPTYAI